MFPQSSPTNVPTALLDEVRVGKISQSQLKQRGLLGNLEKNPIDKR